MDIHGQGPEKTDRNGSWFEWCESFRRWSQGRGSGITEKRLGRNLSGFLWKRLDLQIGVKELGQEGYHQHSGELERRIISGVKDSEAGAGEERTNKTPSHPHGIAYFCWFGGRKYSEDCSRAVELRA